MKYYKLAEAEEKFAELIWNNEPIGSLFQINSANFSSASASL